MKITISLTDTQVRKLQPLKARLEDSDPSGMLIGQFLLHSENVVDVKFIEPSLVPKLFALFGFPEGVKEPDILGVVEEYYGNKGLGIYNDYRKWYEPEECFGQVVKLS